MLLNRLERHRQNLEHARWRVEFLLSLLDSHRQMLTRRDAEWQQKEADYVRQLAAAQVELERLDKHEAMRWREQREWSEQSA
jgi:hypothetical protein